MSTEDAEEADPRTDVQLENGEWLHTRENHIGLVMRIERAESDRELIQLSMSDGRTETVPAGRIVRIRDYPEPDLPLPSAEHRAFLSALDTPPAKWCGWCDRKGSIVMPGTTATWCGSCARGQTYRAANQ